MAIKWPLANGNWSNAANWNDGTLPDVGDDVHADGKTVTIDQDITVLSIRTTQRSGGTAGGGFNVSIDGITVNSDILPGNSRVLTFSGANTLIYNGNILAGSATGLNNSSTGTINGFGNVSAGADAGVLNFSTGVVNWTGNIIGGTFTNAYGIRNVSSGTTNITGTVTGGNNSQASGVYSNSSGTIIINGIAQASPNANGARNDSNGIMRVVRSVANSIVNIAGLQGTLSTGVTVVREIEFGVLGQFPLAGFVKFENGNLNQAQVTLEDNSQTTLIDLDNLPNELPTESNVRQGTSYNSGNKLGTLAVPDPSNVRKDIPTDDTVGTAELTGEDILQAIQDSATPLAERLRNVSTVQTTGDQISTI